MPDNLKQSRAKIVLCILDCCFSGGAPARVLEDSPIPRDIAESFEVFTGKGRILIAASNINEPAYESPIKGHGILTQALIESFQSDTDSVSLPTVTDRILETVRAEAGRLGVVQTPVFLGIVEGGLTFPSLHRSTNYFSAFPEQQGIRISSAIAELVAWDLPQTILTEWSNRFSSGLNHLQLSAVNDHRILDGNSLLVVAPTSSGKTFIGEMAATKAMLDGHKTVFLFPYKALTSEKYDQFSNLL